MNGVITDLSALLATQLQSGSGSARATFGGKTAAFAWSNGLLNSAISYVASDVSESSTFQALKVTPSADVVAVVDGTQKPITSVIVPETVSLKTYPGVCEIKTGQMIDSANLGAALNSALYSQALLALDKALVTDLLAVSGGINKAADVATIAEAQAHLMGLGFAPSLVIMSPTVYASIVGGAQGILTSGANPQDAVLSLFGSRICVSSSLTGAQAIVLDATAVSAVEHAQSPVALVDQHARLNTTDVVIELVAGHLVTQDLGVVPIKTGALK